MLEHFFLLADVPAGVEKGKYIPGIVALSYIIASLGSFTGLRLATDIHRAATQRLANILHLGGAFAFGVGIWSMHFIGMLAYEMDMAIAYDPFLTLLSMVIAAIIAYCVLAVVKSGRLNIIRLISGSVLLGMAICAMHYTGMAAMEMDGDLRYRPGLFFLSLAIAITASCAALWIVFTLGQHEGRGKIAWQAIAALAMGAAICGMHYTGMAAAVFIPWAECRYDPDQRFDSLALMLAGTSGIIFVIALGLSIHQGTAEAREKARQQIQNHPARLEKLGRTVFLQLSALLTVLILLFSLSYIWVIHTQQKKIYDSAIVNGAGLQRMLIQRFTREITMTIAAHGTKDWHAIAASKKEAGRTQELIETNFAGFLTGGQIVLDANGNRRIIINPIPFPRAVAAIREAQEEWQNLERSANVTLQADAESITDSPRYAELAAQANKAVRSQDNAVYVLEEEIRKDTERVILFQQIVFISSLAFFLVVIAYAYYRIFLPINLVYSELKNHRDNLQNMVLEQTKDLLRAKENVEGMNLKLQRERDTIKLLELITNAINESDSIHDAIQVCLREVCNFAGWPIGHAYVFDKERKNLVSSKVWHLADKGRYEMLRHRIEEKTFTSGVGLPGMVYENGQHIWVDDIAQDPNFPRKDILNESGIRVGVGFPVKIKKDVVAVLEFFAGDTKRPDQDFMNIMGSVGTQLGRIIERETIQESRKEAEKANQAKSEFLANMSHELRTPLNSIIGMTRMFTEDRDLSSDNRTMAGIVLKSASNLLEIVNDILDISKVESGNMVLEKTGFDIKDTVANVMETLAPIASSKGVGLKYHYEHEDMPYLVGDPLRVGRILTNLVSNAIKYTDKGEVGVTFSKKHLPIKETGTTTFRPDESGVYVNIDTKMLNERKIEIFCTIKDTGIGIPANKLKIIFDKFTQADETISRRYGGTGLGLAITKDLVELMGGEIGVESEVGRGSTFWFRIPFDTTDNLDTGPVDKKRSGHLGQGAPVPGKRAEDARILVAEDHLLNQEFIRRLLKRMGFRHIDLAENGTQAVQAYRENPYDLILMDCHMPDMNGYEATAEIRAAEKASGTHIPIIALTADAMSGTRDKCLNAGMDEYITKPIDADILADILSQRIILSDADEDRNGGGNTAPLEAESPPVDLSVLRAYAETPEDLAQMVTVFLTQAERDLATLVRHCVDGQSREWVEIAHKMKGGAGTAGAHHLQKLCARAQAMENSTRAERVAIAGEINAAFKEARNWLEESGVMSGKDAR